MDADEAKRRANKAQRTRKTNVEEREKLLQQGASIKSELKALKKMIKDGWTPPVKGGK